MSERGRRFRQHMVLRGFAAATKERYEGAMVALVRAHGGVSPDQLTRDQIQGMVRRTLTFVFGLANSPSGLHRSAINTAAARTCGSVHRTREGRGGGGVKAKDL